MYLPYSRQSIDESDIEAVTQVMRSDFLTQGPKVKEFEKAFSEKVGSYATAFSSGTAALHGIMYTLGVGTGDQVIVPAMTFVATANAVRYTGADVVFADVDEDTLLIDWESVDDKKTDNTEAVVGMDFAGQQCGSCGHHTTILDACHSLGLKPNTLAWDGVAYSFHPTKAMTTGEGGMAVMYDSWNERNERLRNHGRQSGEMLSLGYNYRMNEMSAALGLSQLKRLDSFIKKRQEIGGKYDEAFTDMDRVRPLTKLPNREHAYHLYVIKTDNRDELKELLSKDGIETQIHYKPVNLQPYYNQKGVAPVAERVWKEILSIPIFPDMTDDEQEYVIDKIRKYRG